VELADLADHITVVHGRSRPPRYLAVGCAER
jgi:hypothetical protein